MANSKSVTRRMVAKVLRFHGESKTALGKSRCRAARGGPVACYLLVKLGAASRQGKGSHVLFYLDGAIINLQNQGGKAKAYQVAQIRELLKTKRGL